MYKRVLIALDLEGVNFAVGEPYNTLTNDPSQYEIAKSQAIKEVNAVNTIATDKRGTYFQAP